MKTLITVLLIICSINLYSGKLDNYKMIHIPTLKYQSGSSDTWGISQQLNKYFNELGIKVISDNTLPTVGKDDAPYVAFLNVNHTNVFQGYNHVYINIYNYKQELIITGSGKAMGMSLQADYRNATRKAIKSLGIESYAYNQPKNIIKDEESTKNVKPISQFCSEKVVDWGYDKFDKFNRFASIPIPFSGKDNIKISFVFEKYIYDDKNIPNLYYLNIMFASKNKLDNFQKIKILAGEDHVIDKEVLDYIDTVDLNGDNQFLIRVNLSEWDLMNLFARGVNGIRIYSSINTTIENISEEENKYFSGVLACWKDRK